MLPVALESQRTLLHQHQHQQSAHAIFVRENNAGEVGVCVLTTGSAGRAFGLGKMAVWLVTSSMVQADDLRDVRVQRWRRWGGGFRSPLMTRCPPPHPLCVAENLQRRCDCVERPAIWDLGSGT